MIALTPGQWIKLVASIALASALFGSGMKCGRSIEAKAHDQTKAAHARVLSDIAARTEKARQAMQAYTSYVQDRYVEQSARYETEKRDAYNRGRDTALAVRRGDLRLQDRWTCDRATAGNLPTPDASGEPDGRAADRAESAGRIVQAAAECDAQVRGLQQLFSAQKGKAG